MTKSGENSPIFYGPEHWQATQKALALQMLTATFDQNIAPLKFAGFADHILSLTAPTANIAAWVASRLSDQIASTIDIMHGIRPAIQVTGDPNPAASPKSPQNGDISGGRQNIPAPAQTPHTAQPARERGAAGATADPERVKVGIVHTDPLYGFIPLPHYVIRFWGAALGSGPIWLWLTLRSYGYYVDKGIGDWPSIAGIVDTMGAGMGRAAIMGRAATSTRPRQIGAVDHLLSARLIYHYTEGEGTTAIHAFKVLDNLPLLAPAQVRILSGRKQAEHEAFLGYYKAFNYQAWASITAPSLIPDQWWQ